MNPIEFHPFEMQFEVPDSDRIHRVYKKISGAAASDHLRLRLCGAIALPLCHPVGI